MATVVPGFATRAAGRVTAPLSGRSPRSWALDAAVAAGVAVSGFLLSQHGHGAVVVSLCLFVLLLGRRVWPMPTAVLIVVGGGLVVGVARADGVAGEALAVLVMIHTVAVLRGPVRAIVLSLFLEVLIVLFSAAIPRTSISDRLVLFALLSTPPVSALVVGLYRAARDRDQGELQLRNRHLEVEREQRDLLAAAEERARIAREMHDLIAHHLTVVVALSEGVGRSGELTSERSQQALATTVSMARQALQETRRLLGATPNDEQSPAELRSMPGLASLDGLISATRATGLPVSYEVTGTPPADEQLSTALQLTVFRLVQESLTNTMKHARGVRQVTVRVSHAPDRIGVQVQDDGDPGQDATSSDGLGRGLLGMRERVQSFGGTLTVGPGPGNGWLVEAGFPVRETDRVAR